METLRRKSRKRDAIREELRIARTVQVSPKGVDREIPVSLVTGIGEPYGIYLEEDVDSELMPIRPQPVVYTVLEGKHAGGIKHRGMLTAVSGQEAVLEPAERLSVFDNLLLEVGDGLYAKVTESGPENCRSGRRK